MSVNDASQASSSQKNTSPNSTSPNSTAQQKVNAGDSGIDALLERIKDLESEIAQIKSRNQRVETNKAWETSFTRIFFLVGLTYVMTSVVFWLISAPSPLLNAFIPTLGFWLSVQSLPVVKRYWLARQ